MPKSIAIIGAGNSGISAFNACREQGLNATVFEKTNQICGQWLYREEITEFCTSIYRSVTTNSSKEMTAFSNFPPPKDFPNYLPHSKMAEYISLFADRIGLKSSLKLSHEVLNCEPNHDYEETGKWKITVRDMEANHQFSQVFDGVMVCTGQVQIKEIPKFDGLDQFKGTIIHSKEYKHPKQFENKRVLVIGCGVSGGDIAVELADQCSKVYVCSRSGTWITHRLGIQGYPYDYSVLRRSYFNIPITILDPLARFYCEFKINHKFYGLKPRHNYFDQLVFFSEEMPLKIMLGRIIIKKDILRFTENGVIFKDDDKETQIDKVIMATGYRRSYPFLEESVFKPNNFDINNHLDMYKNIFLPHLKHPKTLAFIGLSLTNGAVLPIAELQCRWFAVLMTDRVKALPTQKKMWAQIKRKRKWIEKHFPEHQTKFTDGFWVQTMDALAKRVGAKPNLLKYFFTDTKLWYHLYFGPCLPYHFRLEGPNKWSQAREAILTAKDRMECAMNNGSN